MLGRLKTQSLKPSTKQSKSKTKVAQEVEAMTPARKAGDPIHCLPSVSVFVSCQLLGQACLTRRLDLCLPDTGITLSLEPRVGQITEWLND